MLLVFKRFIQQGHLAQLVVSGNRCESDCRSRGREFHPPGVASLIPACPHTFVEIDREIISTAILLPSAELFKKGCCQLQAKVCARSSG